MQHYKPPPLNRRIVLRNPASAVVQRNQYGGQAGEPTYSEEWTVWAHRADLAPQDSYEDGATVELVRSRFTIRYRGDLSPDVEIVDGATVFGSVGQPLERGVRGGGATHLQIIAEARA